MPLGDWVLFRPVRSRPQHGTGEFRRSSRGPQRGEGCGKCAGANDGRSLLRVRFKTCLRVTKLSQHEADGGKFQEREGVAVEIFPILGEPATTIEPCDGSFDDPTLG